jgi:hypothetical protein
MNFKPKRIKERLEPYKKDPQGAFYIARTILKDRWPEAEPFIMKDPLYAYNYTYYVLGGYRWPEAEPYIMKHPRMATDYAFYILGERWPEAEPYIKQDPVQWDVYKYNFKIK